MSLHGSESLAGRKRGPKPKYDAKDGVIAQLEKHAAKAEARVSLVEKLLDLQKKVSVILGIDLSNGGES